MDGLTRSFALAHKDDSNGAETKNCYLHCRRTERKWQIWALERHWPTWSVEQQNDKAGWNRAVFHESKWLEKTSTICNTMQGGNTRDTKRVCPPNHPISRTNIRSQHSGYHRVLPEPKWIHNKCSGPRVVHSFGRISPTNDPCHRIGVQTQSVVVGRIDFCTGRGTECGKLCTRSCQSNPLGEPWSRHEGTVLFWRLTSSH